MKAWLSWFSIDTRALGVLRIAFGSIILLDLALRAPEMSFWLGPDSFYPIELAQRRFVVQISAHMWSANMAYQWFLFALAAVFGGLLLIGRWSRTAAAVSWYLQSSLALRNINITDVGDDAFGLTLLWLIFLPIGARFSLDARKLRAEGYEPPSEVASWASLGIQLQVASFIFFSVFWKLMGTTWWDGTALLRAVGDDLWARPLGLWLTSHPVWSKWATWITLALEFFGPLLLLFTPTRWQPIVRPPVLIGLIGFFLILAFCIDLGLIPVIMIATMLVYVSPAMLDRVLPSPTASGRMPAPVLGNVVFRTVIPVALIVLMLFLNVEGLFGGPVFHSRVGNFIYSVRLAQGWSMYAPDPRHGSNRLLITTLKDGEIKTFAIGGQRPGWPDRDTDPVLDPFWDDYRMKMHIHAEPARPRPLAEFSRWYCRNASMSPERIQVQKVWRKTPIQEPSVDVRSVIRVKNLVPWIDCSTGRPPI